MKKLVLDIPTFGFVVATRAMLGVGLGLLLSQRMTRRRRRETGMALAGIGAAATIPALIAVLRASRQRPSIGAVV